ncbi:Ldh family oxidoreductase, partial [Planctomycetota bacterium]
MIVPAAELKRFVKEVFAQAKVPDEQAAMVADCLVSANLSGVDSHGVVRLAHYIRRLENGSIKSRPEVTFEQTAPAIGIVDGDDGLGHVAMVHACKHAMTLAEASG